MRSWRKRPARARVAINAEGIYPPGSEKGACSTESRTSAVAHKEIEGGHDDKGRKDKKKGGG